MQGLTLDEIIVDMKGGRFNPGQAYVAFNWVKTLQGLHIQNFNASAIKEGNDVHNEMVRLNTKLLQTVPKLHYDNPTILLLNGSFQVRSTRKMDNRFRFLWNLVHK
jgi:hypothetical protein